jgi:beta-lactamase superfamily II metal-dependent hydrolase
MEGSDLVVNELYPGLLKGEHPLILLHRIRTDLHGRLSARSHDWASLVVYEALPPALEEQLEEVRYRQGMRAVWIAFDQLDAAMIESADQLPPERHTELAARVESTADALPLSGPFRLECLGLRAGSYKRLAEAAFWAAMASRNEGERASHLTHCCSYLEDALKDYEQAAKGFLLNQAAGVRPVASMHWVLGQLLCIAAVLGKPVRDGTWETARLSAETYIDEADMDGRGWAYASLAELWLLRLADPKLLDPKATDEKHSAKAKKEAEKQARHYATELIKLARSSKDPQIQATHAQFMRYVEWWSAESFENEVARLGARSTSTSSWKKLGIVRIAREIIGILEMRGPGKRSASAFSAVPAPLVSVEPPKTPAPPTSVAQAPAGFLGSATRAKPTTATAANGALFNIEMLPAGHGDCLWVEYGEGPKTNRVLIDCGTKNTYEAVLKARIGAQAKSARDFELFILTHIDDDHIGGGIEVLKDASSLGVTFADVWFNGWKHIRKYGNLNAKQGEIFSELTAKNELNWNLWKSGGAIVLPGDGMPQSCKLPGGLVLTLLSPTEDKLKDLAPKWKKEIEALGKVAGEGGFLADVISRATDSTDVAALADARFEPDAAENNGSSIAVLAEYEGKSVLFGADAHAPLLVTTIKKLLKQRGKEKLKLDAFKLPHHGSQNNLSKELMALLDCRNYLVSTNGSTFKHPDREAIGRVIHYGGERPRLYFNYESPFNAVWKTPQLQSKHNFETVYPADAKKPGLIVRL